MQTFLLHFWQGMPPHLMGVLGSNVVVNIVGICDSILYRSVCSILMSSVIRVKSNQIQSNQIQSNQIKYHHRFQVGYIVITTSSLVSLSLSC